MDPVPLDPYPFRAAQSDVGEGAYIDTDAVAFPIPGTGPGNDGAAVPASPWAAARRAVPSDILLPAARRWLASLPEVARPGTLARAFPRLVNRIALAWADPRESATCIDDLLADRRGGRRGFPAAVAADLRELRAYLVALHPVLDAGWTDASR